MEEHFIKKLMSTVRCGVCGQPYQTRNIKVLKQGDDVWFLNVSCASCQTRALVAAVVKESKAPEPLTELTMAECLRFAQAGVITADDILDLHVFLDEFDGDFITLLGQDSEAAA